MCGIFGFFGNELSEHVFMKYMLHRGPDAQGVKKLNGWTLGHLRLSIIDLGVSSNQPYEKDGAVLIFNGEIYNYEEIRRDFLPHENFSTGSDTEVLISMLNKFGMRALNKLNGMFSFAYISKSGDFYLVRDRYGVKPLYYYENSQGFVFSSELKPLLSTLGSHCLDQAITLSYLSDTATDFDSTSGYEGIRSLPKGSYLQLDQCHNVRTTKWYHGDDCDLELSDPNGLDIQCEEILIDAVKIRLRSDVPLAITLSGGVDSSTIYTLIKENFNVNIQPFIFKHPSSLTDESNVALKLAQHYGDSPIVIEQNGSFVDDLKAALYHLELPIWDVSAIAYYSMYREISERGFKVVIEGHGADEQLGGYPYMINSALIDALKIKSFSYYFDILNVLIETNHAGLGRNLSFPSRIKFILSSLRSLLQSRPGFESVVRESFDYKILPIVLRAFDRLSMAHSLENRMPFMDYRFVEFARKLPLEKKLNKIGNKAILRNILKKYGHQSIYENKAKMGYGSDIKHLSRDRSLYKFLAEFFDPVEYERYWGTDAFAENTSDWLENEQLWKAFSLKYYENGGHFHTAYRDAGG